MLGKCWLFGRTVRQLRSLVRAPPLASWLLIIGATVKTSRVPGLGQAGRVYGNFEPSNCYFCSLYITDADAISFSNPFISKGQKAAVGCWHCQNCQLRTASAAL